MGSLQQVIMIQERRMPNPIGSKATSYTLGKTELNLSPNSYDNSALHEINFELNLYDNQPICYTLRLVFGRG